MRNLPMLAVLERWFTTWRFPSFMLAALFFIWLFIAFMALVPVTDSTWGSFAEEFKVWCFGYDPETGEMKSIYLIMFTVNPLILSLVILYVWYEPLGELLSSPSLLKGPVAGAALLTAGAVLSFYVMFEPPVDDPEFRAEAIRTSYELPRFLLVDQDEREVGPESYDGKVILITSIYASCSATCPLILEQAHDVLQSLSPEDREEVVLMAITMDPEKDTPRLLRHIRDYYGLQNHPTHLLTGEPDTVHALLDRLGFSRRLNESTGEIEHVNLYLLVDREGRIAYRFTLGDRQADWTVSAIEYLVEESYPKQLGGLHERGTGME